LGYRHKEHSSRRPNVMNRPRGCPRISRGPGFSQMDIANEIRSRIEMAKKVSMEKKKLFTGKSETKEENNEMLGLECSTVCSRDVDVYADGQKMKSL